ncbi:MAG: aminodeoxychorismate synthase component I, partial [Actinobacteria bacterium]|nr:aminodeoxychorismate synthase component I [Actinomycetota bacterium]
MEKLPATVKDDQNIPLFYFLYYSKLLAFSHRRRKWFLINNILFFLENGENINDLVAYHDTPGEKTFTDFIKNFIKNEVRRLNKVFQTINVLEKDSIINEISKNYSINKSKKLNLTSNFTKGNYLKAVEKAKKYIHDGDIYQVNMTQRFTCRPVIKPYDLYFILRRKNPAPFSAYLSFPEFSIGSSSPERFIMLRDGEIQTRPIKGTRPRGASAREDKRYKTELKKSIKDRAELNMIVDLERNDLGKFCKYGTVKVSEHAVVEKYARVFHLVSTVTGKVQKGYDIADILKATFPGGSITGAPKIRAMEIIDELENVARGVYTGSIGYIGNDASMDLNIVIRTFLIKDGIFYYNAGGGIVEDSCAESEYMETLDKGLALKETLEYFT